jgi:hypothetical protein
MKHLQAIFFVIILLFISCKTADPARKYPNMVANADPISVGQIDAQSDSLIPSKLNKIGVQVVFYPRLNAVALEFRYEMLNHRQFWDESNRRDFAAALELYKTDYSAKTLSSKYFKTRAAFGKIKGQLEWETVSFSHTYKSTPFIELGYRFRENSPFFATHMRSAKQENVTGTNKTSSQQINMYFTRAQADELVRLFDQSYLMGLVGIYGRTGTEGPVAMDDY